MAYPDLSGFFPNQYQTSVDFALQQMNSRIQNAVMRDDFIGKKKAYNLMAKREAVAITARKQSTPDNDTTLTKYWLTQTPYEWTESFDEFDDFYLSQIVLPTSDAVMNAAYAFNRRIDDVVIAAATGTRYIGEDGTTTDALPGGQTVAVNYVESGSAVSSGLTIGKLRQASKLFDLAEVDQADRYMIIGASQKNDLLKQAEIGNADYNTVRALVDGQINTFMGFNFIHSQRLAVNASVRDVIAFHKRGIKLAIGEKKSYMDVRPDLRHTVTVRSTLSVGAVRCENEAVVLIKCAE